MRQDKLPAALPQSFHGHAYTLYGHTRRQLLADGVLIIGDAAGLATERKWRGYSASHRIRLVRRPGH
jgi:flavin-dependent dehydrogenase